MPALNDQSKLGLSNRFHVMIDSHDLGSWAKVDGLDVSSSVESERAAAFLHKAADAYATHGANGSVQQAALEELLKALFASNEFMFVE